MQFGLSLPNNYGVEDVQGLLQLARRAEELGFHSVWTSEHLFHVAYVLERLGDRPYYEPLTVLSAVAAVTSTIRLGTSVLVLPYHNAIRLAKTVATLDAISNGRVLLGIGVGVIATEFEALGCAFQERGAVTDETIAVMQELWTREEPRFEGTYYRFAGLKFWPKPVQKPYPPLWVGGSSRAAMRRTARIGDGWHPLGLTPAAYAPMLRELRQQAAAAGRDGSQIAASIRLELDLTDTPGAPQAGGRFALRGTPAEIIRDILAYAQAGVENIILSVHSWEMARHQEVLERFAREVMPACGS